MRRSVLSFLFVFLATPAMAAPWVRGYVVTNYEPAWHFGGNAHFQKAGTIDPGSDCPKGSYPDLDFPAMLKTSWRSPADVDAFIHPPNTDAHVIHYLLEHGLTFRGFRDGIDVYINPFSAPDPGMQEVTGKIAEGFDLDRDPKTGGFTSPDGEKGIDNASYRAFGCISSFRGAPYHAALSMRANDKMIEGLYTMVIRVSGNADPLNDDNATIEIGYSPDHVAKGPNDVFLADYSFRLARNAEYSKMKATVKNGAVETDAVAELHAPRFSWFPNIYGDADFHQGRLRMSTNGNGGYSGLIGGYRDWRDVYSEDNFTQGGGQQETREHQDSIGLYYTLKRNADGMTDPRTGRNMGISTAYRFVALPAFVIDPRGPLPDQTAPPDVSNTVALYQAHRAAFYKAIATKAIQPMPKGSGDMGSHRIRQLPDKSWVLDEPPAPAPKVATAR